MLLALLTLGTLATAATDSGAATPAAAFERLARSYADRSIDAYGAMLTADYHFHSNDVRLGRFSTSGLDRWSELASTRSLFVGQPDAADPYARGAAAITVSHGTLTEGVDPEHPDSTAQYRAVVVDSFALEITFTGEPRTLTEPTRHVFYLVRGDVAQLVPGQPADPHRWYVRRWLEDVTGAAERLAKLAGDCRQAQADTGFTAPPPRTTAAARLLAIHPLGNPACPALAIRCDLPGLEPARIEVFDVTGRRVAQQDIMGSLPGTRTLEAGAGAHLEPGAYFVRLTQGGRRPSSIMVVVAR